METDTGAAHLPRTDATGCSGCLGEILLDQPQIAIGAVHEIADRNTLIVRMPLRHVSGSPHRRFAAIHAEIPGIQRTMAVEGLGLAELPPTATGNDGAHQVA